MIGRYEIILLCITICFQEESREKLPVSLYLRRKININIQPTENSDFLLK